MCLRLIIADKRPELFSIWSEIFSGIEEIRVLDVNARTLAGLPDLDAEIVISIFAHERYGGDPKIGESQILSSRGEQGTPPWVITTPPFAAHLEKRQQPDGSFRHEIVQNEQLSYGEENYIVFSKIFDRVDHFNEQNPTSKIKTIGFESCFLNIPRGDIIQEAEAIRNAYLSHYRKKCESS